MTKSETILVPIRFITARVEVELNVEKDVGVSINKIERFWIGDRKFHHYNKTNSNLWVWFMVEDALEEMDIFEYLKFIDGE